MHVFCSLTQPAVHRPAVIPAVFLLLLATLQASCGSNAKPPPGDGNAAVLAFEHVGVLPMTVGVSSLSDATVIVQQGRIAAIGAVADVSVPLVATRIDGRGKWLMPGLTDSHCHIENDREVRLLLHEPTLPDGTIDDADVFLPYVANGVLQIANLSAMSEAVIQRADVESGRVLGPHMMLAAMIDGAPPLLPEGVTRVATTEEDGRKAVRDAIEEGADQIKTYSMLSLDTFTGIVDEARARGVKVVGHIPGRGAGQTEAYFQPGFDMVAHAEELAFQSPDLSDADVARFTRLARDNGTSLIATLTLDDRILEQTLDPTTLQTRPEIRFLNPAMHAFWFDHNPYVNRNDPARIARLQAIIEFNRKIVRAFVDAGIPVLAGTDSLIPGVVGGFALHDEIEALVQAGMTNRQALEAATRLPAEWMGVADDRGTVEVGKRADLLLLDANPLDDVANTRRIAAVVRDGRYLQRAELDKMMEDLAAHYALNAPGPTGSNGGRSSQNFEPLTKP